MARWSRATSMRPVTAPCWWMACACSGGPSRGRKPYSARRPQREARLSGIASAAPGAPRGRLANTGAEALAATLETFGPRVEQVMEQTVRRVFQEEQVPAPEKIVSLFEPHTDILCRGKAQCPVEYGHKVWPDEVG